MKPSPNATANKFVSGRTDIAVTKKFLFELKHLTTENPGCFSRSRISQSAPDCAPMIRVFSSMNAEVENISPGSEITNGED